MTTSRLSSAARDALRILAWCPLAPVDVIARLTHAGHTVSTRQLLARLRNAGLAQDERVVLGPLLGSRPLALWSLTDDGWALLRQEGLVPTPQAFASTPLGHSEGTRGPRRARATPALVATYRLLAGLVVTARNDGQALRLVSFEHPWTRTFRAPNRDRISQVRLPGCALLSAESDGASSPLPLILLLPDLGTAPVASYGAVPRGLIALRQTATWRHHAEPRLIVATIDPSGSSRRADAWRGLLERAAVNAGEQPLPARVVTWKAISGAASHMRSRPGPPPATASATESWHAGNQADHMLALIGRHPFLTRQQLAGLLGASTSRVERVQAELLAKNWIRRLSREDVPPRAIGLGAAEFGALGLVELTPAGRRELVRRLLLPAALATRHHGLVGGERGRGDKRRPLLRNLAHTLGTNALFVALAMTARVVRGRGGDEALEEWRGAASCERRACRPDGYGRYRRGSTSYGFFVEYDRGTERAREYAAKLRAYYAFRDSPSAARQYAGFPTLLVVSTSAEAETRFAWQAFLVWQQRGGDPLPVLLSTTDRIVKHAEGLLGPIWRTPLPPAQGQEPKRGYWLPHGPPRGLFGAGRIQSAVTRLVWPAGRPLLQGANRCKAYGAPDGIHS
jgi:hypothetical protein